MDERIKDAITRFSASLNLISNVFLKSNLGQEEDMSFVMNLIISAYISSLCHLMRHISQGDSESIIQTEHFIQELLICISNIKPINNVFTFSTDLH